MDKYTCFVITFKPGKSPCVSETLETFRMEVTTTGTVYTTQWEFPAEDVEKVDIVVKG